jgi:hypothetical protein
MRRISVQSIRSAAETTTYFFHEILGHAEIDKSAGSDLNFYLDGHSPKTTPPAPP